MSIREKGPGAMTIRAGVQSRVEVFLAAGQSVVIVVDGYANASGDFVLHVAFTGVVAPTPTVTPTGGAGLGTREFNIDSADSAF